MSNIYFKANNTEADIVLGDDSHEDYIMRIDKDEIYLKLGDNADEIDKDNDNIIELKDAFINIGGKIQYLTEQNSGIDISGVDIDVGGKLDVSNSFIVPRRNDNTYYKKDGSGCGISGEIFYDTSVHKFYGLHYDNGEVKFKEFGGGSSSNSGKVYIKALDD